MYTFVPDNFLFVFAFCCSNLFLNLIMRKKNVGDILQNYFDAQNLNFLEHLEQQDLNLQNHFKMLENLFSSDNDSYQLEQKLKIEKNNLENKINSDNIKFKNKLLCLTVGSVSPPP